MVMLVRIVWFGVLCWLDLFSFVCRYVGETYPSLYVVMLVELVWFVWCYVGRIILVLMQVSSLFTLVCMHLCWLSSHTIMLVTVIQNRLYSC